MIPGVRRLQSGMTSVTISRTDLGEYIATNEAGSQLAFGEGEDQFSAVELLLVALGGCTGIDVDYLTARRSEPTAFEITVSADKVSDPRMGNHLENVVVTFQITFPDGPEGTPRGRSFRWRRATPMTGCARWDAHCSCRRTSPCGFSDAASTASASAVATAGRRSGPTPRHGQCRGGSAGCSPGRCRSS